MYKGILIAWIAGIACMGMVSPIQVNIFVYGILIALMVFIYWGIKQQIYRSILLMLCAMPMMFNLGHYYANHQLTQRLAYQEKSVQDGEIIVYIDDMNQLTNSAILQKAEILSGYQVQKKNLSQPIYWLLRTPLHQTQHHPLLKDYRDEQDDTSVSHQADDTSSTSFSMKKSSNKQNPKKIETLKLGQYYRLTGQIRPNHGYANAGSFDSEKWLVQQNIMAGFKIKTAELLSPDDVARLGFAKHIQQQQTWSKRIVLSIEQMRLDIREFIITKPLSNKGLLLALLTGDRSLLTDEVEQQFQKLGISHLLAISGPHVLILALMLTWLINRVIIRYRVNLYLNIARPYVLCIPFLTTVLFYTAFVGFEIPALRTLLVSSVIVMLLLLHRQLNAFSILLMSASLLLLFDPFSILSASFWLSFGASFILLRVYQTINVDKIPQSEQELAQQTWWDNSKIAILALFSSQWKIFIALFPLVMIFFQKVSWFSPVVNLIAIPILGLVIVPFNMVAGVLYFIYADFAYIVWWAVDLLLSLFLWILNSLQTLLSIELMSIAMQPAMIMVLIIALVLLFLPKNVLPKSWIAVCFIAVLLLQWQRPHFELHVLDVGQGQSIFVKTGQHNTLIDTGGYYDEDRFSIGQNVVVPFLLRQGVKQLDDVILSHLDHDHSGALPYIVRDIQVNNIISNENLQGTNYMAMVEAEAKRNIRHELCQAGQHWTPTVASMFRVYSPFGDVPQQQIVKNRNEYSCVIHLEVFDKAGKYSNFLIMGDAGHQTEKELMRLYPDLKVDVLILGHHGSRHSTSAEFLDFYRPKLAIASAGYANRYKHPHREVVELLAQRNIPLLNTSEQGTISFKLVDGKMQLESYRDGYRWLQKK